MIYKFQKVGKVLRSDEPSGAVWGRTDLRMGISMLGGLVIKIWEILGRWTQGLLYMMVDVECFIPGPDCW